MTRFLLVAGTTRTAEIEGISAAGATGDLLVHTPSADAEIVTYGEPVRAPVTPVSPTGCPTPAVVTRAALSPLDVETTVVDGGLARPTGAPTVSVGARPGEDVRESNPVPTAPGAFSAARQFGRSLPDDEIVLGETVPGGTTTALGVLRALGEDHAVSSSFADNPVDLKEEVVADALAESGLAPGDCANDPRGALRYVGDPVLATVAGLARGALSRGATVTLAGGTQMVAVAALLRHDGIDEPVELATTSFVADDVPIHEAADDLDCSLTVTDPGFAASDHVAMERYCVGEAKEGVGMGGALALAHRAGVPMADVRDRVATVYDAVCDEDALGATAREE